MRTIPPSELILNADGSIFHLHLHPDQVADTVILVGDPARVELVASHFQTVEHTAENREFRTVTGTHNGKRLTVLSTGIGIGNIDICLNELDALVNIDFATRQVKPTLKSLTLVRLGTCGALQPDIKIGNLILAETSCGFDGLLGFYEGRDRVCDLTLEEAFVQHTDWNPLCPRPYFVHSDPGLCNLFSGVATRGITIAAPGFYAPQGRHLRIAPARADLNALVESFRYNGLRVNNFEMEGSALAGLAALMGHRATTLCTAIAQRTHLDVDVDYRPFVERMIDTVLKKLTE